MTELRVMPLPSSAAMTLADLPSAQRRRSVSVASVVHLISHPFQARLTGTRRLYFENFQTNEFLRINRRRRRCDAQDSAVVIAFSTNPLGHLFVRFISVVLKFYVTSFTTAKHDDFVMVFLRNRRQYI